MNATPATVASLPPILLPKVLDAPECFRALIEEHAPYAPVQRYFANAAEAVSQSSSGPMIIAPNFRGDWAYDKPLVEGAEIFLEHPGFRAAAARLFGSERVRPFAVYTNLTWQLPFHQGAGHTDVPAFRGIDRSRVPTWLLNVMGHSRLFEAERVQIATAVAWFYAGQDGGFEYWPDGPESAPLQHEGDIFNTACVGDNDRMFHRVMPVGVPSRGLPRGMTLDSQLEHLGEGAWRIQDGASTLAEMPYEELRISVSWKAMVFRDAEDEARYDAGREALDLSEVYARFERDLSARQLQLPVPASRFDVNSLHDEALVRALSGAYVCAPHARAA